MRRRRSLALALCLAGATAALAAAGDLREGERLYRIHCQACHGPAAKGHGPLRQQLDVEPPDLTMIAAAHGGEFPTEEMRRIVDGRHQTPAHGTREMPVWGFTFQTLGGETVAEDDVEALITALTDYLESIQSGSVAAADRPAPDD